MTDTIVFPMSASEMDNDYRSYQYQRANLMIAKTESTSQTSYSTALTSGVPGSQLLTQDQWTVTANSLRLTRRERQVCERLFEGSTRNEIADQLGIKPRTVRHYMEHIHEKLAVSNRVGVVLRIIQMRDWLEETDGNQLSVPVNPTPTAPGSLVQYQKTSEVARPVQ